VTCAGYWASSSAAAFLWLASLGLVINWFGDSLDGTLARHRQIERPKFGFFIDHTMDAVSETLIVFGLGLSPYVTFEIAAVALIGYLLMSVLVYVRTYVTGEFRISYGRFGPTEVRLIIILFNAVLFFVGIRQVTLWFGEVSIYDFAIGGLGGALIVVFLVSTTIEARQLAKAGR
jgi:phosphatidylglycerophosphate synthase